MVILSYRYYPSRDAYEPYKEAVISASQFYRVDQMLPTIPRLSTLPRISQPFKRSQEGLFHGKMKQYGNNVPHSKHKTRRTWLPNVQSKRLTSEVIGETFKLKVTTSAMKSINKVSLKEKSTIVYSLISQGWGFG